MKRSVLFILCTLFAMCSAVASAQGWAPGPIGAPPVVGPGPEGGFPMMPGPMGPSCAPGGGGQRSVGVIVGWQPDTDLGIAKFSTQGQDLYNKVGNRLDFQLEGVWVGLSGRMGSPGGMNFRAEARQLFPSQEKVNTLTPLAIGTPGGRSFTSKYAWRVFDIAGGLGIAPCVSIVGGLRYDFFDVHMSNPGTIGRFSTSGDEGDFRLLTAAPYLGFEWVWCGGPSGFMVRAVGAPISWTQVDYGLTFGDPTGLPVIRDEYSSRADYGAFYEATVQYGRKVSPTITIGGFASIQQINSHHEVEMKSTRAAPEYLELQEKTDLDANRRSIIFGGSASLAFGSL